MTLPPIVRLPPLSLRIGDHVVICDDVPEWGGLEGIVEDSYHVGRNSLTLYTVAIRDTNRDWHIAFDVNELRFDARYQRVDDEEAA